MRRVGRASISRPWSSKPPLPGERVDPCITCALTVENLVASGLRSDVVAPGLPPLPLRV